MRGLWLVVSGALCVTASCFYDVPPLADQPIDASPADAGTMESGGTCTCVPPIPAGWAPALYTADMQPACPSGSPKDWVASPTAPASTCTCACSPTPTQPPSCNGTANFAVQFDSTTNCAGPSGSVSAANFCTGTNVTFSSVATLTNVKATVSLTPTGGACAAGTAMQNIPPATHGSARSCPLQSIAGSCKGSDACLPTAPAPFKTCISKSGDNACPNAFPNKTVAGDAVADTRACGPGPCACAITGTCSSPSLHLYTQPNCSLTYLIANFAADGSCSSTSMQAAGYTVLSTRYNNSQAQNVACAASSYGPTGGLTVTNPTTFCCL